MALGQELLSPIALFIYKRPDHTKETLKSLIANPGFADSELYVFCDGPRTDRDADAVKATREEVRSYNLPNASIIERDHNLGLANSIIQGASMLCERYGRVIVVEDDLRLSPWFLDYMNRGLSRYENETRVMQISGHMFAKDAVAAGRAVLLPLTTSWGWATWERAWRQFDPAASGYSKLLVDKALRRRFELDGAYPYYRNLKRQLSGKVDSWAIRWYLTVFLAGGLTLYPGHTLVQNFGFDGSGEHCSRLNTMKELGAPVGTRIDSFPDRVAVDSEVFEAVKKAIIDSNRRKWRLWP